MYFLIYNMPAVVPGPLPVHLGVPARCQPGEVIGFAKSALVDNPWKVQKFSLNLRIWLTGDWSLWFQ